MLLLNIDYIPGKEITEALGIAKGSVVMSKHLGKDDAEAMGADAIINIRYSSSSVMQGAAEVTAYGTAVKTR